MSRLGLMGGTVLACGLVVAVASGGAVAALSVTSKSGAVAASGPAPLDRSEIDSISCAAPGDCAAGGRYYVDGRHYYEAFVLSETDGSWGKPIEVPGTATLNTGRFARVKSISCAAEGECAAGGYYTDGSGVRQAFVVSETDGSWGDAIEVPGTAKLNAGAFLSHGAEVDSISCAAVGECGGGGHYTDGSENGQAFVVSETSGSWGNAIEVPGTATLNADGNAVVKSVSCTAAGECAAGGYYTDGSGNGQAFLVGETGGSWGNAVEAPATTTLNTGGLASVSSISCAAPGQCGAGGYYEAGYTREAFVVSETSGSWGNANEVPGTAKLNKGGFSGNNGAATVSISCAAAGECAAGGIYTDRGDDQQAFVADETNGVWGRALEVPGTHSDGPGGDEGGGAEVDSISCAAAGDCAATGNYTGRVSNSHSFLSDGNQAFVVSERDGKWGSAINVPHTSTLNTDGDASANAVSCTAAGDCAAGGYVTSGYELFGHFSEGFGRRAYIVSETNGKWRSAIPVFPACVVPNLIGSAISSFPIPYVAGATIRAAKRTLKAADCGVGKITRAHAKAKTGHVIAEYPAAGKLLKAGARVALTVSKGKKT